MAYSVPLTAVSNATLTAAQWNASVRDNILETAPAKVTAAGQYLVGTGANTIAARAIASNSVITQQTTVSTSYADLTTVGPSVTVTTGTRAVVFIRAAVGNDTAGARAEATFAVSGATTVAETSTNALYTDAHSVNRLVTMTAFTDVTLNAGSNTFTMRYRVGSNTGIYAHRTILVIPF